LTLLFLSKGFHRAAVAILQSDGGFKSFGTVFEDNVNSDNNGERHRAGGIMKLELHSAEQRCQ
jgi:hypothetical protein